MDFVLEKQPFPESFHCIFFRTNWCLGVYAPLPIAGRVSLRPFCPLIVTNDVVVNKGAKRQQISCWVLLLLMLSTGVQNDNGSLGIVVFVVVINRGAKRD